MLLEGFQEKQKGWQDLKWLCMRAGTRHPWSWVYTCKENMENLLETNLWSKKKPLSLSLFEDSIVLKDLKVCQVQY